MAQNWKFTVFKAVSLLCSDCVLQKKGVVVQGLFSLFKMAITNTLDVKSVNAVKVSGTQHNQPLDSVQLCKSKL